MVRTVRILSTYRVGERVPLNGQYVCVPCGYRLDLMEGDVFPACINCMRVSRPLEVESQESVREEEKTVDEFDEELVAESLELWEFLAEPRESAHRSHGDPHHRRQ